MMRVHHVLLCVVVCLLSPATLARDVATVSPLVGTWRAVSTVDEEGKESAIPSKPTDNPRMTVTFTFRPDQSYEMHSIMFMDRSALPKGIPDDQIDELIEKANHNVKITGRWSLTGDDLTVQPDKTGEQGEGFTRRIVLEGDALSMILAGRARMNLVRAK
ncbi:MAG: lipocalin family protein [Myxococcota bacterium]|jgi:hypothetical protein|nr:lipocalin family protein [Myxococcota bacterium]